MPRRASRRTLGGVRGQVLDWRIAWRNLVGNYPFTSRLRDSQLSEVPRMAGHQTSGKRLAEIGGKEAEIPLTFSLSLNYDSHDPEFRRRFCFMPLRVELPTVQCRRSNCGYVWVPRMTEPRECPKCKSKEWSEPEIVQAPESNDGTTQRSPE